MLFRDLPRACGLDPFSADEAVDDVLLLGDGDGERPVGGDRGGQALRLQLREYAAAGKTVIISSHQLGEMEHFADVIGVIHQGVMKYEGTLHELQAGHASLEDAYFHLTRGSAV